LKKTFKLTQEEFIKVQQSHRKKINYIPFIILMISVYLLFSIFETFKFVKYFLFIYFLVGMFLMVFMFLFKLYSNNLLKKEYLSSRIFTEEMTVEYSNIGMNMFYATGEEKLSYETFIKWKEDNDFYLLYLSNRSFIVIPKRIMNKEELEMFNGYLNQYIEKKESKK